MEELKPVIESLRKILEKHRAIITCEASCWCWDVESEMIRLEQMNTRPSAPDAEKMWECEKCGFRMAAIHAEDIPDDDDKCPECLSMKLSEFIYGLENALEHEVQMMRNCGGGVLSHAATSALAMKQRAYEDVLARIAKLKQA